MSERESPHSLPTYPVVRDDVVFRSIGPEWVAYDPVRRKLHVLNATAALIWSLCDGDHDEATIASVVSDTLQGSPDRPAVLDDVRDVLRTFSREQLLR